MKITEIIKNMILDEYPDYLIYPNGFVYSLKRNKFIKSRYDRYGYLRHSLKNIITNKIDTILVHHLVGKKYLDYDRSSGLIIDHIDNNKENNDLTNLQIISQKENNLKYYYKKINKNGLPACINYTKKKKYTFKLKNFNCEKSFENLDDCLLYREEIFKSILKDIMI